MDELYAVVTLSEASALYHVSISTLRYHIVRGHLDARLAGKTYLISTRSLNLLYPYSQHDKTSLFPFVANIG